MRWSGSRSGVYRWLVSSTQAVGFYYAVASTSVSNAWAVGGTNWFSPQTLAEHWNGRSWTQVATPTPDGTAYFEGIAATSRDNAWAVGVIGDGPAVDGSVDPLIEHWNGKSWSKADYPEPARGFLAGVTAISADDVWAVGHIGSGPGTQTLIEHWNGQQWSVVPSPNPTGQTDLWRVAAASPDDAWAVGYTNPNSGAPGTAAFHWNGKSWTVTSSVNPPGSGLSMLADIVIISAADAWAVGSYDYWSATLIEHWNGTKWVWHLAS